MVVPPSALTSEVEASKRRLSEVLGALWKNWAFRLSLSSNELFHSNVLQFFAEVHTDLGSTSVTSDRQMHSQVTLLDDVDEAARSDSTGPQAISPQSVRRLLSLVAPDSTTMTPLERWLGDAAVLSVHREWNDMDLAVLVKCKDGRLRPLFALEVKIKSYPRESQLSDYVTKLRSHWKNEDGFQPPLFLLTGMGGDIGAGVCVPVTNFDQLAGRLMTWAVPERSEPIRNEYVDLCRNLHELFSLLDACLTKAVTMRQVHEIAELLLPFRVHAVWWKLWGSFMARECRQRIGPSLWSEGLHAEHHFTQVGVVEVFWRSGSRKGPKPRCLSIGVQVQGASVRLFLNVVDDALGGKSDAREAVERALLRLCWRLGVFRANPRMPDYLRHWSRSGKHYTNPWEGSGDIAGVGVNEQRHAAIECGNGWGRRKRGESFEPRLHGYANANGDGHADFRLTLKPSARLSDVLDLIEGVVVKDLFSVVTDDRSRKPLLRQVVEEHGADPSCWLNHYVASAL
jgi:hypothetical protein